MEIKDKIQLNNIANAIKPWGKLFSDSFPFLSNIVDICQGAYKAQKDINFLEFMEGLAIDFWFNNLDENNIRKLEKKLQHDRQNQIIGSILDAVFFSKNRTCRLILGMIAGIGLRDDSLDYENMTLVIALKDLLDEDLQIFKRFYAINEKATNDESDNTCFYVNYSPTERLVLDKLQNLNIFGKDLAANRLMGNNFPLRYQKTSVSHRFIEYLNAVE